MRYLIYALVFFTCWGGQALGQMSIVLEDETGQGFKLIINDYLQNNPAARKLALRHIPLETHQVQLVTSEGTSARRSLDLQEPGIYRYVVTTNFEGKLQLRYRGQLQSIPAGYPRQDYSQLIAYEESSSSPSQKRQATKKAPAKAKAGAKPAADSSSPSRKAARREEPDSPQADEAEAEVSDTLRKDLPKSAASTASREDSLEEQRAREANSAPADSQRLAEPISSTPQAEQEEKPSPAQESKSDSAHLASRPESLPKDSAQPAQGIEKRPEDSARQPEALPEGDSPAAEAPSEEEESDLIAEVKALEYEFEKLKKVQENSAELKREQVAELLKVLRYDQSRISLLNELLEEKPAWREQLKEWLPLMDYEQSRKTLQKRWNGK